MLARALPTTERLTFGLVPTRHDLGTRALLNDLCERLSAETGLSVSPHCAPSPSALASAIQAGRVHVAWSSPMLLVLARELDSVVPLLATVREGSAAFHAVLFAGDASPVRALEDLRGSRVAWVAPTSAAGYVVPRAGLAQRGLDPSTLFAEERFYDAHGEVARAVLEGRADVGATFAIFEGGDASHAIVQAGYLETFGAARARIVDVFGPVPADMIVAAKTVSFHVRARITSAFSRLAADTRDGSPIRALLGAEGFAPLGSSAIHDLYDLARAARDDRVTPPSGRR
jgi:phosphonate transport system substrate-binding protein